MQFYKLKHIVCAVGLIASPIGFYRKMFSLIIFLGLRQVICIRVRGLCLVYPPAGPPANMHRPQDGFPLGKGRFALPCEDLGGPESDPDVRKPHRKKSASSRAASGRGRRRNRTTTRGWPSSAAPVWMTCFSSGTA